MEKEYIKVSMGERIFRVVNICILTVLATISIYPMIYVLMASLSDGGALLANKGFLILPAGKANLEAYSVVFNNPNIINGFKNIFMLLLIGIPLQVMTTALGAYFFSRRNVPLQKTFMLMIIVTMFFSGGMIPFFLVTKKLFLNETNNYFALIIPFLINPYNLIIMRTSFAAIPTSLEESAKIDGAHHWTIFFKVILPLSKSVVAVMVLYYGVAMWNGWFWASVLVTDRKMYPLQLFLREILIQNQAEQLMVDVKASNVVETIKYATIIVSTLPILIIYPLIQKHFAKGVMIGAIKG